MLVNMFRHTGPGLETRDDKLWLNPAYPTT